MKDKAVTHDRYGITFHHPTPSGYTVAWWQIERDGMSRWLDHLREKNWFTQELEQAFTAICGERAQSVYFN